MHHFFIAIDYIIGHLAIENEDFKLRQSKYYENSKKRSRRLIQKGALLEKYFECEHLSIEDTESFSKMFAHVVNEQKPEKWKKEND
ncbi:hypothetical protein [Weissella confusa]|uniref:hypothetical protein n=1 Tax=Weissella TaxID=46255 RepID=UPI0022E5CDC8|nr:hypothetical protein [Weissella confusa]